MSENQEADKPFFQQPLGMAVAAATPFAGMIGQGPVVHDPWMGARTRRFSQLHHLAQQAQPGDILLTSKPKGSLFKKLIQPISGSDFYHAQGVVGRKGRYGTTLDVGDAYAGKATTARRSAVPIHEEFLPAGYKDVLLLRPKTPLTAHQKSLLGKDIAARATTGYDYNKAVTSWLKDLYLPKVKGMEHLGSKAQAVEHAACEGNICSTIPAQAHYNATGESIIKGKRPQDVFPSDFLRSPDYKLIGAHLPSGGSNTSLALRKVMPVATRLGMGALTAGAAYGASEKPDVAAGLAGAATAGVLGQAAAEHYMRNKGIPAQDWGDLFPKTTDAVVMLNPKVQIGRAERLAILRRYFTRKLPTLTLGAAGGYYGFKAVRRYLANKERTYG